MNFIMPDPKNEVRSLPSREVLLAADKWELVERIEALQADLQKRIDTLFGPSPK